MAISLTCPSCSAALKVKDEMSGKRGRCPHCQGILVVPAQAAVSHVASPAVKEAALDRHAGLAVPGGATATIAAPQIDLDAALRAMPAKAPPAQKAAPLPADIRAQVMAGFRGEIQPVPVSPMYRMGIVLTAMFMVLLPMIYVGLIVAAIWGIYWHLTHSYVMFEHVRGRAAAMALVVYLAPIAIGAILVFFMVKPLFAWSSESGRTRSLTPKSDPLLFEFVQRICAIVRAPLPSRIEIDCNVNASAGSRGGWLSLFRRDLVLTIGMPLVAGLTLQELAGVLAHEFGHFSQGAGMRLTYVIRSINFWFIRVVYERDAWDEWLESSTEELDIRIAWVLYLAKFFVWVTRGILWLLMYVGHIVAGFMLRQMEFDADRYEARVAGSHTFESTCRKLHLLGAGFHAAQSDLASYHQEGRLVDNLPRLMMANIKQFPSDVNEKIRKVIDESQTGLFDSHPADKDRIASARAEQAMGVFHSDLPATALFQDFDAAAKNVTWDLYCEFFGPKFKQSDLHPVDDLIARQDHDKVSLEATERFFLGAFCILRPLRLASYHFPSPHSAAELEQAVRTGRSAMEVRIADYQKAVKEYDDADTQLVESRQAKAVFRAGLWPTSGRLKYDYQSSGQAESIRDRAATYQAKLASHLEPFEDAAGRRLYAAIGLLFDEEFALHFAGVPEMRAEMHRLLPVVSLVTSQSATILELRNLNATLGILVENIEGNERNESLIDSIRELMTRVHREVISLRGMCDRLMYPFDHAQGQITLSRYALPQPPLPDNLGEILDGTDRLGRSLMMTYARCVGRLCAFAEMVESELGLEPFSAGSNGKAEESALAAVAKGEAALHG